MTSWAASMRSRAARPRETSAPPRATATTSSMVSGASPITICVMVDRLLSRCVLQQRDDVRRGGRHGDAGRLEGRLLLGGRARRALDDRAGVAHALAGRRAEAGDVGDHRLGDVLAHERRGALLVVAADLADEHDGLGLVVGLEELEALEEAEAVDRVAAHADARSTGRGRPA